MGEVTYGPQPWTFWRFDSQYFRVEMWWQYLDRATKIGWIIAELDTPANRQAFYERARSRCV